MSKVRLNVLLCLQAVIKVSPFCDALHGHLSKILYFYSFSENLSPLKLL